MKATFRRWIGLQGAGKDGVRDVAGTDALCLEARTVQLAKFFNVLCPHAPTRTTAASRTVNTDTKLPLEVPTTGYSFGRQRLYNLHFIQYVLNEMKSGESEVSAADKFVEEMGLMFQDAGDPRIAGRIFGLLVVEGRELSLQRISERLGVSRASVSTNARQMAKRGTIRLTAHSGDRQDFYELNNFPSVDVAEELAERMLRQAQAVKAFVQPIRAENMSASERIDDLSKAFGQAARLLSDWAAALRNDETIRKDTE